MKNVITFDELMKELEKHRGAISRSKELTDNQNKFLIICRDNLRPVTYKTMTELWEKAGWGEIKDSTIRNYYIALKKQQQR